MKIVLEAFGKLKSAPMDVPEDTGTVFRMVLTQPLTAIMGWNGMVGEIAPIETECEFEWTGNYYAYSDDARTTARVYVLRDVIKRTYPTP